MYIEVMSNESNKFSSPNFQKMSKILQLNFCTLQVLSSTIISFKDLKGLESVSVKLKNFKVAGESWA